MVYKGFIKADAGTVAEKIFYAIMMIMLKIREDVDTMRIGRKTPKKEKATMSVSLYGNLFFVVLELGMAIYTSSQAVLLDAVYDGIEFFMLLPSVFLILLLYKPSNEKHPFGYMQIETVFIVVKGITMTAVTIGLIANSMNIVLHGGRAVSFDTVTGFDLS